MKANKMFFTLFFLLISAGAFAQQQTTNMRTVDLPKNSNAWELWIARAPEDKMVSWKEWFDKTTTTKDGVPVVKKFKNRQEKERWYRSLQPGKILVPTLSKETSVIFPQVAPTPTTPTSEIPVTTVPTPTPEIPVTTAPVVPTPETNTSSQEMAPSVPADTPAIVPAPPATATSSIIPPTTSEIESSVTPEAPADFLEGLTRPAMEWYMKMTEEVDPTEQTAQGLKENEQPKAGVTPQTPTIPTSTLPDQSTGTKATAPVTTAPTIKSASQQELAEPEEKNNFLISDLKKELDKAQEDIKRAEENIWWLILVCIILGTLLLLVIILSIFSNKNNRAIAPPNALQELIALLTSKEAELNSERTGRLRAEEEAIRCKETLRERQERFVEVMRERNRDEAV